ncbi:MAG: 8-oxo-dGTP diphosphatase, partial [Patescibacteria group bacterium]|nr:8-oxo-dGTP diphosphatase [Patescibacteria group bacterium]
MSKFNFYAAVYLVARKEDKILLLRRFNTGWMDGMYTLPAGHIDGNETAEQAMVREAKEEVNLDILPEDFSIVHIMHRNSGDREYFDIFCEPKNLNGEPKNNEENKCDDLNWFPIDALPENTLDYIKQALKLISEKQFFSNFG